MRIDHIDRGEGRLPEEYRPTSRVRRALPPFPSPSGDDPAVFAVHFEPGGRTRAQAPGDTDWDVDEGDWATGY